MPQYMHAGASVPRLPFTPSFLLDHNILIPLHLRFWPEHFHSLAIFTDPDRVAYGRQKSDVQHIAHLVTEAHSTLHHSIITAHTWRTSRITVGVYGVVFEVTRSEYSGGRSKTDDGSLMERGRSVAYVKR